MAEETHPDDLPEPQPGGSRQPPRKPPPVAVSAPADDPDDETSGDKKSKRKRISLPPKASAKDTIRLAMPPKPGGGLTPTRDRGGAHEPVAAGEPKRLPRKWVIGLAKFCFLLFMAMTIPSTGRIVMDESTTPPTVRVEDRVQHIVVLALFFGVPVLAIILGELLQRSVPVFIGWIIIGIYALMFLTYP